MQQQLYLVLFLVMRGDHCVWICDVYIDILLWHGIAVHRGVRCCVPLDIFHWIYFTVNYLTNDNFHLSVINNLLQVAVTDIHIHCGGDCTHVYSVVDIQSGLTEWVYHIYRASRLQSIQASEHPSMDATQWAVAAGEISPPAFRGTRTPTTKDPPRKPSHYQHTMKQSTEQRRITILAFVVV